MATLILLGLISEATTRSQASAQPLIHTRWRCSIPVCSSRWTDPIGQANVPANSASPPERVRLPSCQISDPELAYPDTVIQRGAYIEPLVEDDVRVVRVEGQIAYPRLH